MQLRMTPTAPAIDAAAVHRFVRRFANPAMASCGRAALRAGRPCTSRPRRTATCSPPGASATGSGRQVRAQALARLTDARSSAPRSTGRTPATVALVDGRPQVVKATPGVTFTPDDVAAALMRAIALAPPHRPGAPDAGHRPRSPTPTRAALGIRRQLSSFTVRAAARVPAARVVAGRRGGWTAPC